MASASDLVSRIRTRLSNKRRHSYTSTRSAGSSSVTRSNSSSRGQYRETSSLAAHSPTETQQTPITDGGYLSPPRKGSDVQAPHIQEEQVEDADGNEKQDHDLLRPADAVEAKRNGDGATATATASGDEQGQAPKPDSRQSPAAPASPPPIGSDPLSSDLHSSPAPSSPSIQQAQTQQHPPPSSASKLVRKPSATQLDSIDEASSPTSPTSTPAVPRVRVNDADKDASDERIRQQELQKLQKLASSDQENNTAKDTAEDTDDSLISPRTKSKRPESLELNAQYFNSAFASVAHNHPSVLTPVSYTPTRPQAPPRRQSLLSNRQLSFVKALLQPQGLTNDVAEDASFTQRQSIDIGEIPVNMVTRKIWVKRPHASATLVQVNEDDLVDDVRDMILRKYANSLGKTFDSPDLTIRISPREDAHRDRTLGPEESICRTLDAYFPGGQNVEEALIIDIPRRTPKASPRPTTLFVTEDGRPSEAGEGYFPPVGGVPSPHHHITIPAPTNGTVSHSIAVLETGHIPSIPSPGGTRSRIFRERTDRPRLQQRAHTSSSPTVISNTSSVPLPAAVAAAQVANHGMQHYVRSPRSRTHSHSSEPTGAPAPSQVPMPTSPVTVESPKNRVSTPPPRVASPRPSAARTKKAKKLPDHSSISPGLLHGGVPPISVLIVEDNPINLKLLEAFVKRLKVRWQTAMNGRDAVKKWRNGGFHLVLMDIQLPVMNGLDATREIRRLERVNSIGVFSNSPSSVVPEEDDNGELKDKDRLEKPELFKSPVIIVALTASSLQSDRHDALAAGCNDFLTKVRRAFLDIRNQATLTPSACQLCLAGEKGHGVGLYAGAHRLRRLAQVERLFSR